MIKVIFLAPVAFVAVFFLAFWFAIGVASLAIISRILSPLLAAIDHIFNVSQFTPFDKNNGAY